MKIVVGARGSKLSVRQVEELFEALKAHAPEVEFESVWVTTRGDRDQAASLRGLEKSDFFTREIDQMQLEGRCQISIHSAKDLPQPLPRGLKVVALTEGVDSSDSLVMRDGERFERLAQSAEIGSSSMRRDAIIRGLRPDLTCVEVRGDILKRLEKLFSGEIDGLVVAEAALIRLGLTHLNRIPLPGERLRLQGKLAVVARAGDREMEQLFAPLDSRKKRKTLHVGLNPKGAVTHLPLIEIVARNFDRPEIASAFADIPLYTHIIFTSRSGVDLFFDCLNHHGYETIEGKEIFVVGRATAERLKERGALPSRVASEESQEGVIHLLAMEDLDDAYILLPQSSRARPTLAHTLMVRRVRHQLCHLYDTRVKVPHVKPNLEDFDEIIFTSPSTVEAFIEIFGSLPKGKRLTPIGPITDRKLKLSLT
ncbi:MAG: Porphobilinogen deaminase [Chlamydiae bacterium]|nr:Porphobilinogen deaminase [Chlamydiota bacterium]